MPRQRRANTVPEEPVTAYQYSADEATRKNNPEAGLASYERTEARETKKYDYDPHLPAQLIWAGKAERDEEGLIVDTVSLHIHERISVPQIIRQVQRQESKQLELFADAHLPLDDAIDFYQHDVDWSNRMILGDSLLVMNSLLEKEGMAGKVQMIYIDPPYGVNYNSNFQPEVQRRDVRHGDDNSLTREPEMIKAYRDTWRLGLHSYLSYFRDRLRTARELLAEEGSLFVQISDDNIHHVREVIDEITDLATSCQW
jgi:adenine-specific DNA-methyltransferase